MPTQLTCTRENEWAVVVVNDENKATITDASPGKTFGRFVKILFLEAERNQKRVMLSVRKSDRGELVYEYCDSPENKSHEAFIRDICIDFKRLHNVNVEITTNENA